LSNGTVTVIDSGNLTVRTNIAVGGQPQALAASTDSTRVAVTTTAPDTLQVIDTTLDQLNTSHALAGPPKALIIF
jgi:YVTN family beta-propeller protein